MKKYVLLLTFLLPCLMFGGINPFFEGWESSNTLNNWITSSNGGIFNLTSESPCQGINSVRAKLSGNSNFGSASLTSPKIGDNDGGEITFSYSYKWLVDNGNIIGNPLAAPANALDLKWQWANSQAGPWYTFDDRNVNNHIESTDCETVTKTFYAYGGKPLYVRVVVSNLTATGNNYIYIDDVSISEDDTNIPTCGLPTNLRVTSKTSTSLDVKWNDPLVGTAADYEWEVRTGGEPGSGAVGLQASGTGTSANPNTLSAATNYKIYVRVSCGANNFGPWLGIDAYTNCAFPPFNPTLEYNLCGIQDLRINLQTQGTVFWFDEENNFMKLGNVHDLTDVDESYKFHVFSGFSTATSNKDISIGTGIGVNNVGVPFPSVKGSKVQYIYTAEELKNAGFEGGIIRSFGLQISTTGTVTRSNFAIYMGETLVEEFATNDFIATEDLKLVKTPGDQSLVANQLNTFSFDDPFIWDGVSNLVIQFTYSENVALNVSTCNVASSNLNSINRVLYTTNASLDFNGMNALPTGTKNNLRPNGFFDVIDGCFGPMKTIDVNYTAAPDLILSTDRINNCSGQPFDKLYILSGANEYDSYEWSPNNPNDPDDPDNASNAITGNADIGWTFNPTKNMTYVLTAKNSFGNRCVIKKEINVEFNPSPQLLPLNNNYDLCAEAIQELKVMDDLDESPLQYLFNNNLNGVTLSNTNLGDGISNNSTFFTEGSSSLHIAYGAQSSAVLNFDASVVMKNLSSIIIEFDHIAAFQSTTSTVFDYGLIEYSVDNGTTWKSFLNSSYVGSADLNLPKPIGNPSLQGVFFTSNSYNDWNGITQALVPGNTSMKSEKFIVPADEFNGLGTFKLRFKIISDGNTEYPGWFIDNVKITPVSNYVIEWSPIANLYFDNNATIPYDGSKNVGKVFYKGTINSLNVPYKVEVESLLGCKVEKNFTVSIGQNELPNVFDINHCGPLNVDDINFSKNPIGSLIYYNSSTSNISISQISSSGVYYVEQVINKCKSDRVPFNVVISPIAPTPIAATNQIFCGSATIADLAYNNVPGFQINWYSAAIGGNVLINSTPINNGTYYGEFTNGNCMSSNRVAVNVTVNLLPPAITLSDVYICGTSTIEDISVNSLPSATVNWYQNFNDVNPLSISSVLNSGTYYIAQEIGNCESTRTPVNVSVIAALPLVNTSVIQTFCGNATVQDLDATSTSSGSDIYWYGFSTSDTPLSNNTPLTTGTYYVGQSIGDCHSPKRAVSVRILTTNAPIINPLSTCGNTTVASLPLTVSSTIGYKVYTSMWTTTEMGQNDVINTGVYYISKVENGCETDRTPVQITVNARPNAPTGNNIQTFQDYAEVRELVTNESNVIWFDSYNDAVNNVNPLHSSTPLQNDRKYYGVIVGAGNCASLPFEVTVKITLGVNELDLASLRYYPNPVDNEINVSYKDAITGLEVYDLSGKLVRKQSFEANDVKLETSGLSAGTYMIKVLTNNGSQFIKVVKK